MIDLTVLLVGFSPDQARVCEAILRTEFFGLRVTEGSDKRNWPKDALAGGFHLALVACETGCEQDTAGLSANRAGGGLPVIALVDQFDPEGVNDLFSAGADRVIPWERADRLLLDCVHSLNFKVWPASQAAASR